MNSTDFAYWLQGFVELTETSTISEKQWQVIKDHLKLVFDKKTPDYNEPFTVTPKLSDLMRTDQWPKITHPSYKMPAITC